MYTASPALTIGMYAFCNLVPVVIEARHVHVVLQFLILPMCRSWGTGNLVMSVCLVGGLWIASEPGNGARHFKQCVLNRGLLNLG